MKPHEGFLGPVFLQDAFQLMADTGPAYTVKQGEGVLEQVQRARFDMEFEALLIADSSQNPRRVVDETETVENADATSVQVVESAVEVEQFAPIVGIEADGEGVDGEVAPMQIELDAAALHGGQHSWRRVELSSGRHEVEMGGQQ